MKTKLIVGLGNPGNKYENTRHNVGFGALDNFAKAIKCEIKQNNFNGLMTIVTYQNTKVILLKPQTFMNLSGNSVAGVMSFYKIALADVLVLYDDIALPLGSLRLRAQGSAGGHNGIKHLIQVLHSDQFARLKIGIGPKVGDLTNFVLAKFKVHEQKQLSQKQDLINRTLEMFIKDYDLTKIMNLIN